MMALWKIGVKVVEVVIMISRRWTERMRKGRNISIQYPLIYLLTFFCTVLNRNFTITNWHPMHQHLTYQLFGQKMGFFYRFLNSLPWVGYRDGLMAGKEASAQEGFNVGFKQSVTAGYRWGLIRGVISAMSSLPEPLRNRLTSSQSLKHQLDKLHKSVQSISTDDALKTFYEKISTDAQEQTMGGSVSHCSATQPEAPKPDQQMEAIARDLELLLQECPEIKLDDAMKKGATKIGSSNS